MGSQPSTPYLIQCVQEGDALGTCALLSGRGKERRAKSWRGSVISRVSLGGVAPHYTYG